MKTLGRVGAATGLLFAATAQAHTFGATGGGLAEGFAHPFLGLDHLLAMLAVGLWAAQLGGRARSAVPATFVVMIAIGGALTLFGVAMPGIEVDVAVSVLVLGLLIATATRMPVRLGALVVGTFALFHGHAHGTAMPMQASEWVYGVGMLAASALLPAAGLILARLAQRGGMAQRGLRAGGATVAAAGTLMLGVL